jgi:hypothetical protein
MTAPIYFNSLSTIDVYISAENHDRLHTDG